jgi:hypothetical protein
MKKQIIILIVSLFISTSAFSQLSFQNAVHSDKYEQSRAGNSKNPSKVFFGGGIGLGFANGWQINVSPFVGYKFTPKLWGGIGVDYYYSEYKIKSLNIKDKYSAFGPRSFLLYYFTDVLNAQVEYQYIKYERSYGQNDKIKENISSLLLGGGYTQRLGGRTGLRLEILYDVLYDEEKTFRNSPVVYRMNIIYGI